MSKTESWLLISCIEFHTTSINISVVEHKFESTHAYISFLYKHEILIYSWKLTLNINNSEKLKAWINILDLRKNVFLKIKCVGFIYVRLYDYSPKDAYHIKTTDASERWQTTWKVNKFSISSSVISNCCFSY